MPFPFLTEEITPKVGRYYYVKCARIIHKHNGETDLIPIIGEAHKDPQFSGPAIHYHVDGRFITGKTPHFYVDKEGRTNQIVFLNEIWAGHTVQNIEFVPKKCIRLSTGIKPPERRGHHHSYHIWYDTMIGKSCAGKKCPHMGTTMHCRDGKWECPLHHLIGDPATEKIIDYDTRPPEVKSFTQILKKALT